MLVHIFIHVSTYFHRAAGGRVMPVCRLQLVCRPSPPLTSPGLVIIILIVIMIMSARPTLFLQVSSAISVNEHEQLPVLSAENFIH